jgi:hypothetical protein
MPGHGGDQPAAHPGCRPDDGPVRKARDSEASSYPVASSRMGFMVFFYYQRADVEGEMSR